MVDELVLSFVDDFYWLMHLAVLRGRFRSVDALVMSFVDTFDWLMRLAVLCGRFRLVDALVLSFATRGQTCKTLDERKRLRERRLLAVTIQLFR